MEGRQFCAWRGVCGGGVAGGGCFWVCWGAQELLVGDVCMYPNAGGEGGRKWREGGALAEGMRAKGNGISMAKVGLDERGN